MRAYFSLWEQFSKRNNRKVLKIGYRINIFYVQHVYVPFGILWSMDMFYNTRLFLFSLWTHPCYFKPYATLVWEIIRKVSAKDTAFSSSSFAQIISKRWIFERGKPGPCGNGWGRQAGCHLPRLSSHRHVWLPGAQRKWLNGQLLRGLLRIQNQEISKFMSKTIMEPHHDSL